MTHRQDGIVAAATRRGDLRPGGLDEATTKNPSGPTGGIVECAGLPRRNPILAIHQFNLNAIGSTTEPGWLRWPRRTYLDKDVNPSTPQRLVHGFIPQPLDVPQNALAVPRRGAGPPHAAGGARVEPHDVERGPRRNAETTALAN